MLWKIEKVSTEEALIPFESRCYTDGIKNFYNFLNNFAVVKNLKAEALDVMCYDCDESILQEAEIRE